MNRNIRDEISSLIGLLHDAYRVVSPEELLPLMDTLEAGIERIRFIAGERIMGPAMPDYATGIVSTTDMPPLSREIEQHIRDSKTVRIASAFLSAWDMNPLVIPIDDLIARGGQVKILTSLMNCFNRPEVLSDLKARFPSIELRVYAEDPDRWEQLLQARPPAFHVKTFLFEKQDAPNVLAVGSANFSRAGLSSNIEWSYLSDLEANAPIQQGKSPFDRARAEFQRLWIHHGFVPSEDFLARYSELYRRAEVFRQRTEPWNGRAAGSGLSETEQVPVPHGKSHCLNSS